MLGAMSCEIVHVLQDTSIPMVRAPTQMLRAWAAWQEGTQALPAWLVLHSARRAGLGATRPPLVPQAHPLAWRAPVVDTASSLG